MLLLYILWDDWSIFMISGLKEQLQQQLEYTLLKPDCHSWWISKMQCGREDTLEKRYAIKLCFKLGKRATETYGMLQTAFRPSCMNRASVFEWHKRFKEGRESVRDDERCGKSKEVRTPELIGQIKNFIDKDRRVSIETISEQFEGGARGVMVILAGIGHGDTSSYPGLIAFHIALIPLGKVWIQLFSLQLWVNSSAD